MFHGMPLQCISLDCSTLHHALYHLTCHYLQTYVHAYAYIYIHKYEEEYKHKWKTHANKRTNIHIHNIHKPTYCHVHVHRMTLRHISQHHSKSHCLHCIHTKHNIHHDTTKQNIQTHKHAYITYHTHRHIAYAFCPRFQDISTGRHTKLQCTVGYSPFSLSLSLACASFLANCRFCSLFRLPIFFVFLLYLLFLVSPFPPFSPLSLFVISSFHSSCLCCLPSFLSGSDFFAPPNFFHQLRYSISWYLCQVFTAAPNIRVAKLVSLAVPWTEDPATNWGHIWLGMWKSAQPKYAFSDRCPPILV